MVLGEHEALRVGRLQPAMHFAREIQLLLEPQWHRLQEGLESLRSVGEVRFEQTLEFEQRLVVEAHVVEL